MMNYSSNKVFFIHFTTFTPWLIQRLVYRCNENTKDSESVCAFFFFVRLKLFWFVRCSVSYRILFVNKKNRLIDICCRNIFCFVLKSTIKWSLLLVHVKVGLAARLKNTRLYINYSYWLHKKNQVWAVGYTNYFRFTPSMDELFLIQK